MVRATVFLALAIGLINGSVAGATPAVSSTPSENPFSGEGAGEAKPETPATNGEDEGEGEAPAAEAQGEGQGDDAEEADSGLHGLACLEGDATGGRRKGVQRRDVLKRHRFEISAVGGYYASDALSSTYTYGGTLAFYPSEDFGVELLVTRTPVKFRLVSLPTPPSSSVTVMLTVGVAGPSGKLQSKLPL